MAAYDLPPERLERWLDRWAALHGGLAGGRRDGDAVLLTGADGATVRSEPPFPPVGGVADAGGDGGAVLGALLAHVRSRRRVGVVLVRLGGHAVGIFDGGELAVSKVGSRLVHGRHRAGGSSANRFARRRQNQAREALDAAAATAVALLAGPARAGALDAVVRGGDRRALVEVFEDVRLAGVAALAVERIIEVPEPRLKVLRATPEQFLATRLVPSDGA